ncbi:MAG: hypothetical protein M3459_10675, partial [Actinomycetota bacterium]|nr:hypothetical protein [Actinomycetota bacterium]
AAQAAGRADLVIEAEADRLGAGEQVAPRPATALLALAGRVDEALQKLEGTAPLGWSRADHPGPVAVALALVLALDPLPEAPESAVPAVWGQLRALDANPWDHADALWWTDEVEAPAARDAPPRLSTLLAQRARRVDAAPSQRARWLAAATSAAQARVRAIVEAKHRGAYERAAGLLVACAEAGCVALGPREAAALVSDVRSRYPRHVAFRSALDAATRRSPLLPNPP